MDQRRADERNLAFRSGGGALGARPTVGVDPALGPATHWTPGLETTLQMSSRFAMGTAWGEDLTFFCVGTGLGLSMMYGFAHQSGGQVRVHSEPGHGKTLCPYQARHFGAAEAAAEVPGESDYRIIEAADGASGLRLLESVTAIDLLMTDVGLPGGMNGRQMADAGRTLRPDLKVLFITGYAENAVVADEHLEPGMHVLTKPFAMETLAARVDGMALKR